MLRGSDTHPAREADNRAELETGTGVEPEEVRNELKQVVLAAERFAESIEARSIALMERLDLTMPQMRAVMTIRRFGRMNGRQLAAALMLTPGAIVGICDRLEERQFVRRVTDVTDRRITWFELTQDGAATLRAKPAAAIARARTRELLARLTSCEREGFIKCANAFADALSSSLAADSRPNSGHPNRA